MVLCRENVWFFSIVISYRNSQLYVFLSKEDNRAYLTLGEIINVVTLLSSKINRSQIVWEWKEKEPMTRGRFKHVLLLYRQINKDVQYFCWASPPILQKTITSKLFSSYYLLRFCVLLLTAFESTLAYLTSKLYLVQLNIK